MFLFPAAASYYERAYHITGRKSCLLGYMAAMKLSCPEEEYRTKVLTNLKSAELETELEDRIREFNEGFVPEEANGRLRLLQEARDAGHRSEYYRLQEQLVNELREEYRKNENEFI